jgi:hypothetical protein
MRGSGALLAVSHRELDAWNAALPCWSLSFVTEASLLSWTSNNFRVLQMHLSGSGQQIAVCKGT